MSTTALPYRHRYAAEIEGYQPGFVRRILMLLRLAKGLKASACSENWHYREVDATDELVSMSCFRDGRRVSMLAFVPPERQPTLSLQPCAKRYTGPADLDKTGRMLMKPLNCLTLFLESGRRFKLPSGETFEQLRQPQSDCFQTLPALTPALRTSPEGEAGRDETLPSTARYSAMDSDSGD